MNKRVFILSAALLLTGALSFQSCADDDDDTTITPTEENSDNNNSSSDDNSGDSKVTTYTVTLQQVDGSETSSSYNAGDVVVLDGNLIDAGSGKYVESFKVNGFTTEIGSYLTVDKDYTISAVTADYTVSTVAGLKKVLQDANANSQFVAVSISDLTDDNLADLKEALASTAINVNLDISANSSITSIPASAFSELKNVVEVTIPESVQIIDDGAFELCTAIKTVKFKSSNLRKSTIKKTSDETSKTFDGDAVKALIYVTKIEASGNYLNVYAVVDNNHEILGCVYGDKDDYTSDDLVTYDPNENSWTNKTSNNTNSYAGSGSTFTVEGTKGLYIAETSNGDTLLFASNSFFFSIGEQKQIVVFNFVNGTFNNEDGDVTIAFDPSSYYVADPNEENVTEEGGDGEDPEGEEEELVAGQMIIGQSAFNGCRNITAITLPSYISKVKAYAFTGTTSLKVLVVEGNTEFESGAFDSAKDNSIEVIFINAKTFSNTTLEYLKTVCENVIVSSDTVLK